MLVSWLLLSYVRLLSNDKAALMTDHMEETLARLRSPHSSASVGRFERLFCVWSRKKAIVHLSLFNSVYSPAPCGVYFLEVKMSFFQGEKEGRGSSVLGRKPLSCRRSVVWRRRTCSVQVFSCKQVHCQSRPPLQPHHRRRLSEHPSFSRGSHHLDNILLKPAK